jgi:hypothetical protein
MVGESDNSMGLLSQVPLKDQLYRSCVVRHNDLRERYTRESMQMADVSLPYLHLNTSGIYIDSPAICNG